MPFVGFFLCVDDPMLPLVQGAEGIAVPFRESSVGYRRGLFSLFDLMVRVQCSTRW